MSSSFDYLKNEAASYWMSLCEYLASLTAASRWFHVFYLTGPFILLIERSPADLWLSLCGLVFLGRCVFLRNWGWLRFFWVRASLVFWAVSLLSAGLSVVPAYAFGEAFVWIRFPLFAFASCFWLARNKHVLIAMMMSTALGMIVMSGILTAEILIVGLQGGRLSWPYGDLVPGNYLAKAGLPAFCVLVALAVSAKRSVAVPAALISLVTIILSVITGERINFLIRACGGMLAGLMWKPKWKRYLGLVVIEIFAVFAVLLATPLLGNRFIDTFINQLPINGESRYYRVMAGGVIAGQTAPVLGVGTGSYRILCTDIHAGNPAIVCEVHPHNYYIQLFAETGVIGLITGSIMIGAIIWFCFVTGIKNRDNVIAATAFVIPLGLFFPIQSTADFFGQWNNIFMWSAIGLALAARNLGEVTDKR